MQKLIVAVIVLIAAIFVARRLYKAFRSQGADACGCSGCSKCDVQASCTLEHKSTPNEDSPKNEQ
ncbi:MAG: FeoB-associated Cys-rich membrane protein [Desulfovermiculus sp.]